MQNLTDPILNDVARIIDRHAELSPEYKMRLLGGLVQKDAELGELAQFRAGAAAAEDVPEPRKGRR